MMKRKKAQNTQVKQWLNAQKQHARGKLSRAIALGSLNGLLMIVQTALLAYLINLTIFVEEQSGLTKFLTDSSAFESFVLSDLHVIIVALIAIILCRAGLNYFSECYSRRAAMLVKTNIRSTLLAHIINLGPAYTQQAGNAKLSHLLHQGIDSLEDYFAGYLPVIAYCSVIPLAILIAVFPIDWQSGLILLFTAPMVPFFMILIGHKAEALNQQHWLKLQRMSSHFLDIIQGLTQLKIFNASRQEIRAVKKISENYGNETMGILKVAFLSSFVLEFLASISIALVAVVLGFRLYYGDVDYFFALWVLILAPEFYLPFRQLGTQYHAKMSGIVAADEIASILAKSHHVSSGAEAFTAPFTITLNQVNFSYRTRPPTLTDINTTFSTPGLYAIVGESGSGKSTLTDLILGFISPSSGEITINNRPLTKNNSQEWLKHCGLVSQKAQLFHGTLAFNVAMSDKHHKQCLLNALKKAGLLSMVSSLDNGTNTMIGELGAGLSAGQAQRLALARVFYHQPSILILDEPTSHLDQETEQIITQAINEYAQSHIVILVAHRLQSVMNANKIIVLKQGKITETGTHHELLASKGYYAQQVEQ